MLYAVLIPEDPSEGIPRGAAVLLHGREHRSVLVSHDPRELFGERCARAARHARRMILPVAAAEVGQYDAVDGEVRLYRHTANGASFVQFSRRHFVHAIEDGYSGELRVRQGAATTVVWLDIE